MEKFKTFDEIEKEFHEEEKLQELMDYLVENTVPKIIKKIKAKKKEKEEMSKRLEEKIRFVYNGALKIIITYKKEDTVDQDVNKIIEEWNKKTDDEKKSELIYDEAFENLLSNSIKAWKIAKKRAETGEICKDEKLYEEIKYILEKDHSDIKKFNKKYIKNHVSEGLLDLDYGFGKSNAVSLRVGRYML